MSFFVSSQRLIVVEPGRKHDMSEMTTLEQTTPTQTPVVKESRKLNGYAFLSLNDTGISASMKAGPQVLSPLHSTLHAMPTLVAFDYSELEIAAERILGRNEELSDILMKSYPTSAWRCANMETLDDAITWLRDFSVGVEHISGSADFEKREPDLFKVERLLRSFAVSESDYDDPESKILLPLSRLVGVKTIPVSFEGIRYGEQRQMKTLEQEFPALGSSHVLSSVKEIVRDMHRLCSEWEKENLVSRSEAMAKDVKTVRNQFLIPASRRGFEPVLTNGYRIETEPVERVAQALTLQAVCASMSPRVLGQMQKAGVLKQEFVAPTLSNLLNILTDPKKHRKQMLVSGTGVDVETINPETDKRKGSIFDGIPEVTGVRSLLIADAMTGAVTAFVFAQYPDGHHSTVMSLTTSREGIVTGGCARESIRIDSISDYVKNTISVIQHIDEIHDAQVITERTEEIQKHIETIHDPDHDGVWDENYRGALDPTIIDVGAVDEPSL